MPRPTRAIGFATAALSAVLAAPAAGAAVIPGDTFTVAVAGYNGTTLDYTPVTTIVTATFGVTQSFPGTALNGQAVTVTSTESIGATTTTDTVTVSVPTNFAPAGTTVTSPTGASETMNGLELDVGQRFGGTDPLNFAAAVDPAHFSATGSARYLTSSTTAVTPFPALAADGSSVSANESLSASGNSSISGFAVRSFTFSATYNTPVTVPEPATAGLAAAVTTGVLARRRRR